MVEVWAPSTGASEELADVEGGAEVEGGGAAPTLWPQPAEAAWSPPPVAQYLVVVSTEAKRLKRGAEIRPQVITPAQRPDCGDYDSSVLRSGRSAAPRARSAWAGPRPPGTDRSGTPVSPYTRHALGADGICGSLR